MSNKARRTWRRHRNRKFQICACECELHRAHRCVGDNKKPIDGSVGRSIVTSVNCTLILSTRCVKIEWQSCAKSSENYYFHSMQCNRRRFVCADMMIRYHRYTLMCNFDWRSLYGSSVCDASDSIDFLRPI